jgi:hypothetical protein
MTNMDISFSFAIISDLHLSEGQGLKQLEIFIKKIRNK